MNRTRIPVDPICEIDRGGGSGGDGSDLEAGPGLPLRGAGTLLPLSGRCGGRASAGDLDLSQRTPLLAYGANAAATSLARKLAAAPGVEMPVLRSRLQGFDVVYSAHVSPYGAVPATLLESPGATAPVFVLHPTAEQLALLTVSEPNYDLVEVNGIAAYCSKHGPLSIDGSAVALAAVRSTGRTLPELDQPAVLEHVRALFAPGSSLEEFVRDCVERGGGPIRQRRSA